MDYDFAGYVTRNNVRCSDGRVIRPGAFAECDGKKVPMCWMHDHMTPENVIGHCILQNREDGVYGYCKLNKTPAGQAAAEAIRNKDVDSLSIYANKLKQQGADVVHGAIREVSLVLGGANPGAFIDDVVVHDDEEGDEAIMGFGSAISLSHADTPAETDQKKEEDMATTNPNQTKSGSDQRTIQDVIDTMNEEQKNVLYALVGMAAEDGAAEEAGADEEAIEENVDEEADNMKHNVFQGDHKDNTLIHGVDFDQFLRNSRSAGSMRAAAEEMGISDDLSMSNVLAHSDSNVAASYGVENIGMLFPDYKNVTSTPGFVSRDMGWVPMVMGAVSHTPFSRIKTIFADIREDEARAKGYIKGNRKVEEIFTLLKRTTDPQTVYKKQRIDRDDMVDITDFDVILWIKGEMRVMLDEEIARAILVGDGRMTSSDDKIKEDHIRPIWKDDDFYTIKAVIETDDAMTDDDKATAFIRAAIKARKEYRGSGNPVLYTTEDMLTSMLLLTDKMGRDLYTDEAQLAKKLRVASIVTVEPMENQTRDVGSKTRTLMGIIVNLTDYNVGADKGGDVNLFDDFDIDYNQYKYLIETRISGALIKPYSAIAIESVPKA